MSRSSYSDDFGDEYPGQLELYRANVKRSMRGRAGQARLRELRDALLALPVKELHDGIFVAGTREQPQVCALGAWALHQAGGDPFAAGAMLGRAGADADDLDTAKALSSYSWPELVVRDTIWQNDRDSYFRPETPAERYTRVLAWVEAHISNEVTP